MLRLNKILATGALAALVGAGAVVASMAPASAYVVCNHWGHCWNVHRHYYYPAYYGYGPYYGDPYYYGAYGYPGGYYGGYYGGPTIGFGFNFGGGHGGWHGGGHHH